MHIKSRELHSILFERLHIDLFKTAVVKCTILIVVVDVKALVTLELLVAQCKRIFFVRGIHAAQVEHCVEYHHVGRHWYVGMRLELSHSIGMLSGKAL